jgi:hypothetical protein
VNTLYEDLFALSILIRQASSYFRATNKITAKCPEMTNDPGPNKNTALHIAAVNNRTEIATIILLQVGVYWYLFNNV